MIKKKAIGLLIIEIKDLRPELQQGLAGCINIDISVETDADTDTDICTLSLEFGLWSYLCTLWHISAPYT